MTYADASFAQQFGGVSGSVHTLSSLITRYMYTEPADERKKIEEAVEKGITVCANPDKLAPLLVPIVDARFPESVVAKLVDILGKSTLGLDALATKLNGTRLNENLSFKIIGLFGSKGLVLTLADLYERTDDIGKKRVITQTLLEGIVFCEKECQTASLATLVHRIKLSSDVLTAALRRLRNAPSFPCVPASVIPMQLRLQPAKI